MALGCLASPIIGMIADRHFAGQRVLFFLNLLGAIFLFVAARATDPTVLFVLLLVQMLCYMPTWGLSNAIAMAHSPAEKFPQVRVFGSIGWVASGVCSLVAVNLFGVERFDGTSLPMYCGAGLSLIGALVALTLPNTPPPAKGEKASVIDALGLRAIVLMKDFRFFVFIVTSLLVMVPFAAYFSYGAKFLENKGFEYVTVTMNWGQVVEMGAMLLVPISIAALGIRWTMVVGLVALTIRYAAFLAGDIYQATWLFFVAILVHGIIFGFFFVGGQIYIDQKAPRQIRAQAQGFIFLVTFGLGLLLGNFVTEWQIQINTTGDLVNWQPVWQFMTIISAALLVVFALLFKATVGAEAGAATADDTPEAASRGAEATS
jgi:nucleoside transporter